MSCKVIRNRDTNEIERVLAPNGQDSLLFNSILEIQPNREEALKLWSQVYTPSFKEWFGDWEINPQESSKIVDLNGEPLLVHHWSKRTFDAFSKDKLGSNTKYKDAKLGFFFSEKPDYPESGVIEEMRHLFGNNRYSVFLSIKNPVMDIIQYGGPVSRLVRLSNYLKTYREKGGFFSFFKKPKINSPYDGVILSSAPSEKVYNSIDEFNESIDNAVGRGVHYVTQEQEITKLYLEGLREQGIPRPKSLMDYIIAFEPNQIKSIVNSGEFSQENDSIYYQPEVDEFAQGGLAKLIYLKEKLLSNARQQLLDIKKDLKEARDDKDKFKELLKEQSRLKVYIEGDPNQKIEGLVDEIIRLKSLDSKSPELIEPFIKKELDRLSALVTSNDPEDTKEAHEIIEFIKAIGDFSPLVMKRDKHPLFTYPEVYDEEGNFTMTPEMLNIYLDWRNQAEEYDRQLLNQERILFEQVVNNNKRVQEVYGTTFAYDQLVAAREGMKDINWVDMMIMDIGSGIFSQSGMVPQVIKQVTNQTFEKEEAWAKEINDRITHILPQVRKELTDLGYSIGLPGIKNVSYELFKQKYANGTETGNIVYKYSAEWFDEKENMWNRFWTLFNDAKEMAQNSDEQSKTFGRAFAFRDNWFNENADLIDISRLSEVISNPEFEEFRQYFNNDEQAREGYMSSLKDKIGAVHYKTVVDSALNKLQTFKIQRQERLEEELAVNGVSNPNELSEYSKSLLKMWEYENNPFLAIQYQNQRTPFTMGNSNIHARFTYITYIPKEGRNYYDENYKVIESNPTLKEFYDVVYEATSTMRKRFDYETQRKLLATSLPHLEKNMLELFLDKDISFFQALSESFRRIIDNIAGLFGVNKQDTFSYAKVNTITGLPDYQINDTFIKQNLGKINDLFKIEGLEFVKVFNQFATIPLSKFTRFTTIRTTFKTQDKILNVLRPYVGDRTLKEVAEVYGGRELIDPQGNVSYVIPVGKIIYRAIQHRVAQQKSFDLPKVIRMYANLTAQYTARKELLPMMEIMKKHYESIEKQVTQNTDQAIINAQLDANRVKGLRTNAIKQFDNWFERVILGNYGLKKQYGFLVRPASLPEDAKVDLISKYFISLNKGWLKGKIYTTEEKKIRDQIEKLMENLDPESEDFKELKSIKDNLGKDAALSAALSAFMDFIRFKGLGFNLSSGLTNFMEGQVANHISAASGNYFPPGYIYEVTPTDLIYGDFISKVDKRAMPEKVAKAKTMMETYDVLQDASNELQKSSAQSRFSGLSRFNPFYPIKKGEQYNQTPLMVAALKSTNITDKEGNISNVWDATEAMYDTVSKKWIVRLKEGFDTEDNIQNWERANGQDYYDFKTRIRQIIKNTHGDFDQLSGMMAKSSHVGQAITMFKSWLPREFYKRFAVPQSDLAAGLTDIKGRYRSHTSSTLGLQAFGVGTLFLGPIGGLVTGAVGFGLGHFFGAKTNLGMLEDMLLVNTMLFRKLIGIPFDPITRKITGKTYLNFDREMLFKKLRKRATDQDPGFTRLDFNNFMANMQEMAIMFAYIGLLLATKAFFWNDDDEKESDRRKAHNFFANEFIRLAGSAGQYINGVEMTKTITDIAIIKFFKDCGKVIKNFGAYLEGHDIITSGSNAGESALANSATKTFLPSLLSSPGTAGFETMMSQQFEKLPLDRYFWGENKRAQEEIKEIKSQARAEYKAENPDADDKEINKAINDKLGRKKKDETYSEYLDRLEGLQETEGEQEE